MKRIVIEMTDSDMEKDIKGYSDIMTFIFPLVKAGQAWCYEYRNIQKAMNYILFQWEGLDRIATWSEGVESPHMYYKYFLKQHVYTI